MVRFRQRIFHCFDTIYNMNIVEGKNKEILPSRSVAYNISDFIVNPSTGKTRLYKYLQLY